MFRPTEAETCSEEENCTKIPEYFHEPEQDAFSKFLPNISGLFSVLTRRYARCVRYSLLNSLIRLAASWITGEG
jgi:hypothetical protein